jgi:hypothetical protein
MFLMTAKADKVRIGKKGGKVLKQAILLIGLVSMIMFLSGNCGAWADTPENLNDPETVIRMNVKANPEIDLKTLETHMAADEEAVEREATSTEAGVNLVEIDLTGEWEIQEEDKAYQATLDAKGNGPYTWQDGRIQTEKVVDRLWSGTWHQKGNDREGGFEVLLSEDGKTAEGAWWYLRVGTHKNIPSRLEGGTYKIQRLSSQPHAVVEP